MMALGPLSAQPTVTVDTPTTELLTAALEAVCRTLGDLGLLEEGRGISLEGQGADAAFLLGDRVVEVHIELAHTEPELPRAA